MGDQPILELTMTWTELCRLATPSRCESLVLDACIDALARSHNPWLHACVAAQVPTLEALCAALDAHRVPLAYEVEARILMPFRFVDWPEETQNGMAGQGALA
jgi:hypothetical protein